MLEKKSNAKGRRDTLVAIILLASLSFFWLSNALIGALTDIAEADIYYLVALTTAILFVQAIFLILTKSVVRLVFPALGLANTYLLYIIFSSDIGLMGPRTQIGICIAIAVLYWIILDILLRSGRMQQWLAFGLPGLVALFISISAWIASAENGPASSPAPDNIKTVQFKTKPNIYFLSFDSMIPESLARQILDIPPPAYLDVLRKHGAHFIPNMFSDFAPTKYSLSHVLSLDPVTHREKISLGGSGYFDSILVGNRPNALSHILTANGYTTHFTFETGYFGPSKGPHLHNYHIYNPYSACTFLKGSAKKFGFFSYCLLRDTNAFKAITKTAQKNKEKFLIYAYDLIKTIARSKDTGPHSYMQHVIHPTHASNHFAGTTKERDAYRASYQRRSVIAADVMNRMLTEIRTSDPTAIIFLYGDHGPLTSRPIKFGQNKKFFVQDRHGILGAIINAESCEPYLMPPEGERFQTTARVVSGLIQCLSGGDSPFIKNVDFSVLHQIDPNEKYEDYIFE